ncbi:MAG: O-antigen ligase family protein [Candidatus Competibacteraceae bacterium]
MNPSYPPPRPVSLVGSIDDFINRSPPGLVPFLSYLVLGGMIGTFTALVLYVLKPVWVALIIAGVIVLMPTFVVRNHRLYWLAIFLFSLQFEIMKNLNDGLAVVHKLGIDYTIWHFTFELRATDLVFAVLAFFWLSDIIFRGKKFFFPRVAWLVPGFLLFCFLSLLNTPSPYLGLVEISRQLKFFLFFLYAANNIESRSALRLVALLAVSILVLQGAVTALRFQTGYLEPLAFGQDYQEGEQVVEYLSVDREDVGGTVRSFGTLTAPGSTARLCMMAIPFAVMLSFRNPMFGRSRLVFMGLAAFGMAALLLTFTRAYYLTTAVQLGAAFLLGVRRRYLSRMEILLILVLGFVAVAAVTPKLYEQFAYRQDSVTVRLQQYTTAIDMIAANPILGVGLNNGTGVKADYVNITYNEYDPDTQFYLEPTHNLYLSLTSEIGLIGAPLYFIFFGYIILQCWRLADRAPDLEVRFFANALLVAYAGVLANAMYDPLHEDGPMTLLWMYSGIVLALHRAGGRAA